MVVGIRVLGPPGIRFGDAEIGVGGRPLELACRLAVAPRHAATPTQLERDLWAGSPGSAGALRVTVSRLRAAIGRDHVQFVNGSYRLVDVEVDADRFVAALAAARLTSGSTADRIDAYDLALSMWHGGALDGMRDLEWAAAEVNRLDDLHDQALDEWGELLLLAGRNDEVATELGRALDDDPARERRCAVVAVALYRSGHQSRALERIARTRRVLRDELGLHVGGDLADLEGRILRHDPTLRTGRPAAPSRQDDGTVSALLRSAVVLVRSEAYEEAATVIDRASTLADPDDERARALVLVARAQLAMGAGTDDPHPLIDEAQAIGRRLEDGELLTRAALVRFGAGVPDDWARALIELTEPVPLLPSGAPETVDLLCAGAAIVALSNRVGAAERLLDEARRIHSIVGDDRSQAVVHVARSLLGAYTEHVTSASIDEVETAIAAARRADDATVETVALLVLARHHFALGDVERVDELMPQLDRAASRAILPFGRVRASLGRCSVALARGDLASAEREAARSAATGRRHHTFAAEAAVASQMLMIALERDQTDVVLGAARGRAADEPDSVWTAVAALCGDESARLILPTVARRIPRDANYPPFAAFAAEAAAQLDDAATGAQVADDLERIGDRTIVVGLGTVVLGFGAYYAGLARRATGEVGAATALFERAAHLSRTAGAELWEAHALVAGISAFRSGGGEPPRADLARLGELVGRLDAPRLRCRAHQALDTAPPLTRNV